MANNEPDDEAAADSQQQSEQQPAESDQPNAKVEEQPADQADVSTEQPQTQPTETDQAANQAEDQASQNGQPADQQDDQPTAEADQPTEQSDQVAEAEGQQMDKGDSSTTAITDDTVADSGNGGTGVQARPGPRPKRSPPLVKRRFVFRFATNRGSVDNTPVPLVNMVNNALAGGLLAFRIEEVVSGKTVLVGREIGAQIPRPTLPAPTDFTKDDPGDLVYHFNSVGMDLSVSLVVTTPALGTDFSNQLEKVITRTDWLDSTEAGLPEPTFFVNGSVFAGYSLVPVSDGQTLDGELKARNISRKDIFYLSDPRARNDALHTMEYDVMSWEFLSVSGNRLTPK